MKVTLLGTGSPLPDAHRAGPATLVQAGGRTLLFDAGRGVLMRLTAAGVLPGMLDRVLLTHLHSDHTVDFNDLVTTRWVMAPAPMPLPVSGPPGTAAYVDRVLGPAADNGWLIDSLSALLESGCRWSEAAERLGVHRHTLRYRMERLREQTGRHPDEPDQRMELWLAVKASQALAARRTL